MRSRAFVAEEIFSSSRNSGTPLNRTWRAGYLWLVVLKWANPSACWGTLLQGEWRLLYIGICAQRTHISAGRALFAVGLKITAEGLPRHQLFDVRWLAFCSWSWNCI